MFIRNWYPEVRVERTYMSAPRLSPHLWLTAVLICPVCKSEQDASAFLELDPWNVKTLKNLEYLVNHVCAERHCYSCGVSSIVPPAGRQALRQAVEELVTTEWLTECVGKLGTKVGSKRVKTPQDTVEAMESFEADEAVEGQFVRLEPMLLPGIESVMNS